MLSFLGNIAKRNIAKYCFRMNFACAGVPQVSLIKLNLAVDSTCRPTLTVDINKNKWNSNYLY